MKYIIFDNQYPIIFPESIIHYDIASLFQLEPTSAGYVKIENGKVITYDKSHSLNISPKPTDKDLIKKLLNL